MSFIEKQGTHENILHRLLHILGVFADEPAFPRVDQCAGVVDGDTIKVVRYSAGSGSKMSPKET